MAGFWQRLLRRDTPETSEKPKKADNSFFLDPDDAKTLGDINYMRTPRTVKRTFPVVNGQKPDDWVAEISAKEQKMINDTPASSTTATNTESSAPQAKEANSGVTPERQRNAGDLDPFRAMARDIRK